MIQLRSKIKTTFLFVGMLSMLSQLPDVSAQNTPIHSDTLKPTQSVSRADCPAVLLTALDEELLQHKAAFFIINYSSHPLGKTEFRDNKKPVKDVKIPMRMNRITLLYIDSGMHRFHTMYQQKFKEVVFRPGEIFIATLTSRSVWPLPFVLVREDEKGVEYGPVLLYYITATEADKLLLKIKKKEVIVNPSGDAKSGVMLE
jgi:hypothetical protein